MRPSLLLIGLLLAAITSCGPQEKTVTMTSPSFAEFDQKATTGGIPLTVVFFGGSLTWGANASDPERTSYRALMADYLREKYPKAPFRFIDAAIGGTGSKLGIFRLDRDVMAYKPDLVFLDFTANDGIFGDDPKSLASYEGLLRDMIKAGIPVEQAFFGFKYNFGKNYNLDADAGYRQRRRLVDDYQTGSADLYTYLQPKVVSGELDLDKLWAIDGGKDGAHPDDAGYQVFFKVVRDGFEDAVKNKRVCVVPANPVYSDAYHHRTRQKVVDAPLPVGWTRTQTYRTSTWFDGLSSRWMGDVAMCDSKDQALVQPLKAEFTGTLVGIFGEYDENGLDFKAYVDGKLIPYQPNPQVPAVEAWPFNLKALTKGRLFGWRVLSDNLSPGKHTLEIVPVFPIEETASASTPAPVRQLRIESICSAGE